MKHYESHYPAIEHQRTVCNRLFPNQNSLASNLFYWRSKPPHLNKKQKSYLGYVSTNGYFVPFSVSKCIELLSFC